MTCDGIAEKRLLGEALGDAERAHAASCDRCLADEAVVAAIAARLAAAPAPLPPPAVSARALRAAAATLAPRHEPFPVARVAAAVGAALVPLPLLVVVNAWAIRSLYGLLATFLPEGVSLYLVGGQTLVVACLFALAYGSIPILADRQVRALREVRSG